MDSDDEDHGSRDLLKKRKNQKQYSDLISKKTKLENYQKAIDQAEQDTKEKSDVFGRGDILTDDDECEMAL